MQLGNGLLLLLVANYAIFIADKFFFTNLSNILPLVTSRPQWWQFVTSAFVHQDFQHLSGNMFMLWAFGRSLEVDEGSAGLVAYYLLCALGALATSSRSTSMQCHISFCAWRLGQNACVQGL